MGPKQVLAFAIGPVGGAVLSLVTLPIITWFYSVEDVGRIAMLRVITSFCILLFCLGLDQAYVREYHEAANKPVLLKTALMPGFVLLVLALAISFTRPELISKLLFAINSAQVSLLVVLCIIAAFVSRFLSLILRMQERGLAFSMSQILPKLMFLLIIGVYILFSFGFSFLSLVIAQAIAVVSITVVYGWNTKGEWLAGLKRKINLRMLKAMLRYGAPLIVGGMASWGLTAMDRLFLRGMSTFDELGIYSVAASFAGAAIIFQGIFSTIWAPVVYKWVAKGENLDKVNRVVEYVLAAVLILFSFAGIFSWVVNWFIPAPYHAVQYILVACMGYPLFYTLSETTVVGIEIARKTVYSMLASVIAVAVNFAGNFLLVPRYGAAGAAISTAAAFWVFLVLRTEFSCHLWQAMPRLRLYVMTFVCLLLAVLFAIEGSLFHLYFILAWVLVLIVTLVVFRDIIKSSILTMAKLKLKMFVTSETPPSKDF